MSSKVRHKSHIKHDKVLFGFKKSEPEETGYFGMKGQIVQDVENAKIFPSANVHHIKGFGTPEKWLDLINSDSDLNHGYKFHLVSYIKKAAE